MPPPALINLEKARALIVDDNLQALDILASVLTGFGLRNVIRATNGKEAKAELRGPPVDLIVTDAHMPGVDGYEFITWLRRQNNAAIRSTPVILLSAHTPKRHVLRARDCGANFIIAKPISPHIILERILWVAEGNRHFVECDAYVGPDRRWKFVGPPTEHPDGRRRNDQTAAVGLAEGDNLTQSELDQLIKPQRSAA